MKIGMCQVCGDQGKTIMRGDEEYCLHCAGMLGLDADDDESEDDDEERSEW